MKVGGGGFSQYISQVSPVSSGLMRGGFSRTSVTTIIRVFEGGGIVQPVHKSCFTSIIRAYKRGAQLVHLSSVTTIIRIYERGGGVQPVHLSSVSTIIRAYEGGGFSRYISPVSPLSSGPMRGVCVWGGGVQPVHLSSITTIIGAYESMRGGFSRYICQVSPLSSGPMKVEGGGCSAGT